MSGDAETEPDPMSLHSHCALHPAPAWTTPIRTAPQPAPWTTLTKGECVLLALALHRLSRANTGRSGVHEEDLDR